MESDPSSLNVLDNEESFREYLMVIQYYQTVVFAGSKIPINSPDPNPDFAALQPQTDLV